MGGTTIFTAYPASRRLVTRTRPAPLAAILALLALVCLGAGARPAVVAETGPPAWTRGGGPGGEVETEHALALLHLRGGTPGARLTPRAGGAAPPAPRPSVSAALPRFADRPSGAPLSALRPPFARAAAAARDGTLSARSTGVPPPALA